MSVGSLNDLDNPLISKIHKFFNLLPKGCRTTKLKTSSTAKSRQNSERDTKIVVLLKEGNDIS